MIDSWKDKVFVVKSLSKSRVVFQSTAGQILDFWLDRGLKPGTLREREGIHANLVPRSGNEVEYMQRET